MKRLFLAALVALPLLPQAAAADSGRRLEAIRTGRLYDPILTPQLNPDFELDPNSEAMLLNDIRNGRFDLDRLPEGRRGYFLQMMEGGR